MKKSFLKNMGQAGPVLHGTLGRLCLGCRKTWWRLLWRSPFLHHPSNSTCPGRRHPSLGSFPLVEPTRLEQCLLLVLPRPPGNTGRCSLPGSFLTGKNHPRMEQCLCPVSATHHLALLTLPCSRQGAEGCPRPVS